jgi:Uma2 family endonuclease
MVTEASTLSALQLLELPDDGWRYELVEGELRRMSPAGQLHGRIAMRLAWRLAQYVEEQRLGIVFAAETGFLLHSNPDTVRAPDVAFVSAERTAGETVSPGFWPGAPDLAVEVVSPSDGYADVEEKVIDWLAAGSRLVWVVNPRRQDVAAYRSLSDIRILTGAEILEAPELLPGWSVPVRELFA